MKLVRLARLLLGVSAKELAEEAAVSLRELHRIETGAVTPTPATLGRIDGAFERMLLERTREVGHAA
jgi:transcriptional regulator with XRE-family HTH domain